MRKVEIADIAKAIAFVPLLHLSIASIYLIFYCYGFGFGISIYTSPFDLFSTSIGDLAPVYWSGLIFPIVWTILRYSLKHPFMEDAVLAIEDAETRRVEYTKLLKNRRMFAWIIFSFAAIIACEEIYLYCVRGILDYLMPMLLLAAAAPAVTSTARRSWAMSNLAFEIITCLLVFSLSAALFGLNSGQNDRTRVYSENKRRYPSCNLGLLIRRFDSKYLILRPDNSIVIAGQNCELLFSIPHTSKPIGATHSMPKQNSVSTPPPSPPARPLPPRASPAPAGSPPGTRR